jgi:excisionase family DNA binding protein
VTAHDYETDELMTVAEVAAILMLSQQTIRNWIDAGTLPCLRIGERRVRIFRSDFEQFIHASDPQEKPGPSIWDGVIPPPR